MKNNATAELQNVALFLSEYNLIINTLTERMGNMFPPDWEVSERIAVEFCDITRKDIEKLMFKRKHELDTKLLLFAIQKTVNFESLLSRRFTGVTLEQHKQDLKEKKEKDIKVRYRNADGFNSYELKISLP